MEYKQVIVVRKDLKLSKGKLAGQVAHASIDSSEKVDKDTYKKWKDEYGIKIILWAPDLETINTIEEQANEIDLPNAKIIDAGFTELPANTITCIGLGPAKKEEIDKLTSHLKLM